MDLSFKHIAIFGQVKVDVNALDCALTNYRTLLELYQDGWWVTDRYGTIVTLVKPRAHLKDGFCCVCRRISTNVNLDTLDFLTKQIADVKYEQYKQFLQSKKYRDKIKKSKEQDNANNLSTLSQRDKYKHKHILLSSQGKNLGSIPRKD
ncbi:MAG: hypothetical protein J6S85_19135 [Methanobrevibacter sp.]|nr:hypothetical protein [Methanobrevibacter sp.]